jgi:hypothetical protein
VDQRLQRIRELIDLKERTDTELNQLIGIAEKPRVGRPRKEQANGSVDTRPMEGAESEGAP